MPADFEACVRQNGKVRTISGPNEQWGLEKGEYVKICQNNGKTYRGDTRTKKEKADGGE